MPKNVISSSNSSSSSFSGELEVQEILEKRYVSKEKSYLWKVRWSDGDTTWEPKSSFVDDDGTINEVWAEYEQICSKTQAGMFHYSAYLCLPFQMRTQDRVKNLP